MTIEEFNNQGFGAGDKAKYKDGNIYNVASVDFEEQLIGLDIEIEGDDEDIITWVRCENVDYIPESSRNVIIYNDNDDSEFEINEALTIALNQIL